MSAKPAHHRLRELLLHVLRTEDDFVAFVMDHHRAVAQRFSGGQDRIQKTNLLLWHVSGQVILKELKESEPQAVASFESQHGPIAAADFLDRLRFDHSGSWVRTQALMFALGAGLVAGLWLTLHAMMPTPTPSQREAAQPKLSQPHPHAAVAVDMTSSLQTLAGVLSDCKTRPATNVRLVVLGKQVETQSDKDGQFTLRVPGEPDEPVQLRVQPSDSSQSHDHWVNLGQTHLSLQTESCAK
jgi:hypothetical protein